MDIIQFLYTIPGYPLGYLLYFIYKFICSNVGVAIIIFTFIVKLAALPVYIKQQKNQAKSAIFMPKVQEIQRKYANNRDKQQEELMKLQQQGYKPMGGCLSLLLTFLVLFGVIDVVYKPLTHIIHMKSDKINTVVEESYNVELTTLFVDEVSLSDGEALSLSDEDREKHTSVLNDAQKLVDWYNGHCLKDGESAVDISVFKELNSDTVKFVKTTIKSVMLNEYAENTDITMLTNTDMFGLTDDEKTELEALATDEEKENYRAEHAFGTYVQNAINTAQVRFGSYKVTGDEVVTFQAVSNMQRELYALERFGSEARNGDKCADAFSEAVLRPEVKEELFELYDNLNFIGIKLGQVPKDHMGFPMLLIPIVSFIMALAQTFISNYINKKNNPEQANMPGMGMMKVMMFIMPVFSIWIAFTVPAGAGFYWTISYAFGIVQTLLLNKLYNPQKLRAQAQAEWEAQYGKKKSKKEQKKAENAQVTVTDDNGNEETISQKELNRRKLAAARKAQAEKYGEEYHDDDDDLDDDK